MQMTQHREGRKYDAAIFDLDGTLLDTLDDLTASTNAAVEPFGNPPYTREQVCGFVGNGIRNLMRRAVPGGEENPGFEGAFLRFKEHYGEHCMDQTRPYPGIMELLRELKRQGIAVGIVSNKVDFAVKKLRDAYFGELVDTAAGEKEGVRRKPAPDTVFQALRELGVRKEYAVYVGDSDVDIHTAQNAEMDCISVTWGFRDEKFLREQGAERLAADAGELLNLIESGGKYI